MPAHPGSKITERQHLTQVSKSLGKLHHKLVPVELPEALAYLWVWYNDVKTAEPLSCQEILAWSQLSRNELTRFEFDCLRLLDITYWNIYNDRNRKTDS